MAKTKFDLKADRQPLPQGSETLAASGRVIFHIDQKDEGRILDTGWFSAGVPSGGSYRMEVSVGSGDGKQYYGQSSLFEDAPPVLNKLKVSWAVDEKKGAVRLAIKPKKVTGSQLILAWRLYSTTVETLGERDTAGDTGRQEAQQPAALADAAVQADTAVEPAKDFVTPALEEDAFYIENAPTTLHTGWKYTLRAHIPAGMEGQVRWELTDGEEAGSIDVYGCYTAPGRPGAYEVKAYLGRPGGDAVAESLAEASVYLIVL